MRAVRRHLGWGWVVLGLAGSLALAAADSQLNNGRPIAWPLVVHLGSPAFARHVLWAGVAALCAGWLGLGLVARAGTRRLLAAGVLWTLPMLLAPVLFSGDVYSYLAQGDLLRLGVDPYHHGTEALIRLHQPGLAHAVSPFWRHTPAPYGPLFIGLAAALSAVAGSHIVLGVLLMRGLELLGFVLLAVFVPRLARRLGADPARATWLAVVSPLALIELVAGAHNDALLAGLLVAGVSLALDRRPLAAIAVCALAAAVKLPAAAAVVLIAACWLREEPATGTRVLRVVSATAVITAGVLGSVSLLSGTGLHWLTGGLLSTPARVHLAITPGTAAGWSLHSLGASASAASLESTFGAVAFGLAAALSLWLLLRVDYERLVPYLGAVLLAAALGGPATWPWYLTWALALLAAAPRVQRSPALIALIVASVFVIGPGGTLKLSIQDSPSVLVVYSVAALAVLWFHGRAGGPPLRRLKLRSGVSRRPRTIGMVSR